MLQSKMTLIYPMREGEVWFARHKRGPFEGKLSGFGGGIEARDLSPREAACREVFEESRVKVHSGDLRYVTTVHFYRQGRHIECFVYILWRWEGEFQEAAEMEKAVPYPLHHLPFAEMVEGDYEWLPKVLDPDVRCIPHVYHRDDWTLERVSYEDAA